MQQETMIQVNKAEHLAPENLYKLSRVVDQFFENNGLSESNDLLNTLSNEMLLKPGSDLEVLEGEEFRYTPEYLRSASFNIGELNIFLSKLFELRAKHLWYESRALAERDLNEIVHTE